MDKRSIEYDKGWVQYDRRTLEYEKHLNEFLDIAFSQSGVVDKINCPCPKCNNGYYGTREEVKLHLFKWGMEKTYKKWVYHGESLHVTSVEEPEMKENDVYDGNDEAAAYEMLYDMYRGENHGETIEAVTRNSNDEVPEKPNEEALKFFQLLKDAEQKLYPNCEGFSKLSFIVQLFQMKCLYGWSNKSVDALLALLNKVLPAGNSCPTSLYDAQKIIRDLGLDYKKIDACQKDCILFHKEYAAFNQCPKCNESRWLENPNCNNDEPIPKSSKSGKKISAKTVWYFPLKPRLQRLFMSKQIALDMRWHKEKRIDDGILRHPADSLAWKTLDEQYPNFALDPRNVRLGLASDGFNPFGTMSISHSTWPVVLIPYNLPPWLCLKHPYWILSLIIPGPKSPGNDIDVFLQPLIDELKELWELGMQTFDAYKRQNFQLYAALLWTINDFPAFAILSGWSTKGALACPICNKETSSYRLKHGHKFCYMCHRRFLEKTHEWREKESSFDNTIESRNAPKLLSEVDILEQYQNFEQVEFGKMTKKRKRDDGLAYNWKKKSVFFELPYWKNLLLRHNLDVMHVEKNVCDSVLGTLLNIEGKTKDNLNARLDLQLMGIKKDLHPRKIGDKLLLPAAKYSLSLEEKRIFCQFLKDLKMPDSYASNIARCAHVKEGKIIGLKSHDCHILLERLLPLAIRGLLDKDVCDILIELSLFFSQLCSKTLNIDILEHLEAKIAMILCKMEMIFPPSFFDIMVHLPIHLATEAKIAGPVQYRWMYPIERYLRTLKGYVRNKARPEGSIAKGYLSEECMHFCSRYLKDIDTTFHSKERNFHGVVGDTYQGFPIFKENGKFISKAEYKELSIIEHQQAHFFVLKNCEEVCPWVEEHLKELSKQSSSNIERRHQEQFIKWFEKHVTQLHKVGNDLVNSQLLSLAKGPDRRANFYKGYISNGFRFHTESREAHLKTQNSGVVVKGDEDTGNVDYYGKILDIVELEYTGKNRIVLFKCKWFVVPPQGRHQARGYKKDEYGFVNLDITHTQYRDEPFVLASQVEQVYYVKNVRSSNWHTVVKVRPRNVYDIPEVSKDGGVQNSENMDEAYQQNELGSMDNLSHGCIYIDLCINNLHRDDIEGLHVDMASINPNNIFNDDEDDGTNNLHNESSSDDGGFAESVDDMFEDV